MYLSILPIDVFHIILLNLPVSQICRLNRTCKFLNKVGSEPTVWKLLCKRDLQKYSIQELGDQFSSFLFAYKLLSTEESVKSFSKEISGRNIRKGQLLLVSPFRDQSRRLGKIIDVSISKPGCYCFLLFSHL